MQHLEQQLQKLSPFELKLILIKIYYFIYRRALHLYLFGPQDPGPWPVNIPPTELPIIKSTPQGILIIDPWSRLFIRET